MTEAADIKHILTEIVLMDKRVVVLEARLQAHDDRLQDLKNEVHEVRKDLKVISHDIASGIDTLSKSLQEHIQEENNKLQQLMIVVITGLIASLGSIIVPMFLQHLK